MGNGRSILFWDDNWIGNGPLKDQPWAHPFMDLGLVGRFVANYIDGGCWRKLYELDPGLEIIYKAISCVHIPVSPSSEGNFSVASAFSLNDYFMGPPPFWAFVWSSRLIPKINIFFCLFYQNKILTIDNLIKRGFVMPNRCFLCEEEAKNTCHLLFGCRYVGVI